MKARRYFSARSGKNPDGLAYDLPVLRKLFFATYRDFFSRDYFQKMLGKDCVDDPYPVGEAGSDVQAYILTRLRKDTLWPVAEKIATYTEDDVFDMMEFLFDHVSKGVSGSIHQYGGCGMHYNKFDDDTGKSDWRLAINQYLVDYSDGYELSEKGEVLRKSPVAFAPLLEAPLLGADPAGVEAKVALAITRFRARSSSLDERREAVRALADVLEFLRPSLKSVVMPKDEADLFAIANTFGIRHHNQIQKTNYDPSIWLNWMFYFYLATIHAGLRLLARASKPSTGG